MGEVFESKYNCYIIGYTAQISGLIVRKTCNALFVIWDNRRGGKMNNSSKLVRPLKFEVHLSNI